MLTLAAQMVSGLGGERCKGPAPIVKMNSIRKNILMGGSAQGTTIIDI